MIADDLLSAPPGMTGLVVRRYAAGHFTQPPVDKGPALKQWAADFVWFVVAGEQVDTTPRLCTSRPTVAVGEQANPDGLAKVRAGFYPGVYTTGFHKGDPNRPAFVQYGMSPISVLRKPGNRVRSGYFGINFHDVTESEGCFMAHRSTLRWLLEQASTHAAYGRRHKNNPERYYDLLVVEVP